MRYFIEPASNQHNPRYPCGSCGRNVSQHFKAIKCDICNYWNHIKCDEITAYTYDKMLELPESEREKIIHFCKICKESCIPFQKLSEEEFLTSIIKNIECFRFISQSLGHSFVTFANVPCTRSSGIN